MDKKHLEHYKKSLLTKQDELQRIVSRIEQDGRSVDEDTTQDLVDKAASSYTKEFLFSQSNTDRGILMQVTEALERLEQGAYGECLSCGEEIQQKRLEAVPWARHCIPCQEKQEQQQEREQV
jgi:DnaK suppressor protein